MSDRVSAAGEGVLSVGAMKLEPIVLEGLVRAGLEERLRAFGAGSGA